MHGARGIKLPFESCELAEGKAPCCDPPEVQDLVCDEDVKLRYSRDSYHGIETWVCGGPTEPDWTGDFLYAGGPGLVYAVNGEITVCDNRTGRVSERIHQESECVLGCFEEGCDSGRPMCEK